MNLCPDLTLPLTTWVSVVWVATYALYAETLLLGLGLLLFRLRRTIPRGAASSMLVATGCTLAATAASVWMTNRNMQFCGIAPHYTPEYVARVTRAVGEAVAQAHIALGGAAAACVIVTVLTAATLARGGWAGRHSSAATPETWG